MKDEIKEILEWLNDKDYYIEDFGYKFKRLSMEENKALLDYITNLQKKYEEADYDRHKLFEEKQNLKQINEEHRKLNGELREENKRLREENKHIFANVNDDQLLRSNAMNYAEAQDYKTRNEKAIEYIKSNLDNTGWLEIGSQCVEVLINLLQGSDK